MLNFLSEQERKEVLLVRGEIEEIRIRLGRPLTICYFADGEHRRKLLNKVYEQKDVNDLVMRLCDYSLYSKGESVKEGYVTSSDGERVGLCGQIVRKDESVVTVKNVTSLCVRFPNDVIDLSLRFYNKYAKGGASCLVISPPAQGKTTFLRDLGRQFSDKENKNVLFIDERDEFSAGGKFYLGKNSDVMKYSDKLFGFYNGVRTMNPDIIVCDEIMNEKDLSACLFAAASGVKTLASAHSDSLKNLLKKPIFSAIIAKKLFDFFVELKFGGNIAVYNGNGEKC